MQSIKEILPTYLEKIKMAEVEPGFILMVLIWLFSSFFSKKKPKKSKPSINKEKVSQKFQSLLRKLGDLPEMDVNQPQEIFSESEEEFFEEEFAESEFHFEGIEPEEVACIQEEVKAKSIIKKKKQAGEVKLFGTPLQKAMVLKEILDKPRALRPFNY